MDENELLKLKYPIGKFKIPEVTTENNIMDYIKVLEVFPAMLIREVEYMNDQQLDTPYRDGGWTVRQVVHHLADSHINAYCRFKLAISEETPVINAYKEAIWAEMADGKLAPVAISFQLLEAVHNRWTTWLKTLAFTDFQKAYFHPEKKRNVLLSEAVASYAWHSNHHLAHITSLSSRMKWVTQKK